MSLCNLTIRLMLPHSFKAMACESTNATNGTIGELTSVFFNVTCLADAGPCAAEEVQGDRLLDPFL